MPGKKNHRKNASTANHRAAALSPLPKNAVPEIPGISKPRSKPTGAVSPPPSAPLHKSALAPLKPPQPLPPTPLLDYKEVQQNEVEVLKSIWMDDFKPVVKIGAWNVS